MGTLGKIRNRSGLLLTVIGFAMLAFILGDFMQSQRSSGPGTLFVGEVLGEDILISTFEETVDQGIENWKSQNPNSIVTQSVISNIRNQAWTELSRELIMKGEYEKIGIGISDDEWMERISGVNVHPQVSKIPAFQDPNTGQFDRTKVLGYLQQVEQDQTGESVRNWVAFQDFLINVVSNEKYDKLVEKGTFINSEEAKISYNEGTQFSTYNYLTLPYSMIADSLIQISDKEIKDYYKENKDQYPQDLSRDVDYVVFTVVPTKEDDLSTRSSLEDLKSDFENYDDYLNMVRRNSDNRSAIFNFQSKDQLMKDSAFAILVNQDKGDVIGPYKLGSLMYRISKLVDIQSRPDSVEARHILISPKANISLDSVKLIVYNLKQQIENGGDFALLAQGISDDKSSAIKGGELGWFKEGVMVQQFNDVCFSSSDDELKVVETQFGVHLIQVTNNSKLSKRYKIAYIDRNISASTETYNNYYTQAAQFVSKVVTENNPFDTIILNDNLVKRSDIGVIPDKQNIVGLADSRSIVRWMNKAEAGDVSEVFELDNSYVVAKLIKENKEGYKELSDVENIIKQEIRIDKKHDLLIERIGSYTNLEELASRLNINIISNKKAQLSLLNVDDLGYVPEFVGAVFSTEAGALSSPIKSKNSVSVVNVISRDDYRSEGDFSLEQKSLFEKIKTYAATTSYKALETDAVLIDNRSEIY
ncbi:MAG: peptidylprolyl isomerase [Flavobacteriales bacterium]|nr:peptidylprolyl isomerase [Flavobacteriales bacterium]